MEIIAIAVVGSKGDFGGCTGVQGGDSPCLICLHAYNKDMSKSQPIQLTVSQAAARLGLHRNRVLQLIDAGSLPATRLGRWWVLLAADVEAFGKLDRPAGNPNFQRKVKGS